MTEPQSKDESPEIVRSLKSAVKKINDKNIVQTTRRFADTIERVDAFNSLLQKLAEDVVPEAQKPEFFSIAQSIKAKMLDVNNDWLDFLGIVAKRSVTGKSEVSQYFIETVSEIMDEFKVILDVLDKWKTTVERNPDTLKGEMLSKSVKWLQQRTNGPLERISSKNIRIAKLLNKVREEQLVSETYKSIKKYLKIIV